MSGVSLVIALVADRVFGEVSRYHPLVGFGRIANRVECQARGLMQSRGDVLAADSDPLSARQRWLGTLSWSVLVIPPTVLLWLLQGALNEILATILGIVVLYFCLGGRSLFEHANAIAQPLIQGDVHNARAQLARIVSRDTAHLDAESVAKAAVESVLENGSDALLAPIFWFVVAGAPGVLCYRLSNTLDAMWGYRNPRFLNYGRTAARMDDVLNWLPARCCALSYALVGQWRTALGCWRKQAAQCDSPNAGPVMASGAGSLGIVLGGTASYDNIAHWRPILGEGRPVEPADIGRALQLLRRATGLWVVVILAVEIVTWI